MPDRHHYEYRMLHAGALSFTYHSLGPVEALRKAELRRTGIDGTIQRRRVDEWEDVPDEETPTTPRPRPWAPGLFDFLTCVHPKAHLQLDGYDSLSGGEWWTCPCAARVKYTGGERTRVEPPMLNILIEAVSRA